MDREVWMDKAPSQALDRLWVARLVGAWLISLLGLVATNSPDQYLGAAGQLTPVGLLLALVSGLLTSLASLGFLSQKRWAILPARLTAVLQASALVPGMAASPLLAGTVVTWNLWFLGRALFPEGPQDMARTKVTSHPTAETAHPGMVAIQSWISRNGPAAEHLLFASLAIMVFVVGYRVGRTTTSWIICGSLGLAATIYSLPLLVMAARYRHWAFAFAALPLLPALASLPDAEPALAWLGTFLVLDLGILLAQAEVVRDLAASFVRRPAALLLLSFAGLILAGTVLLSFPAASKTGASVGLLDALFTSTSAVCVTGLVVRDTGSTFSVFGQSVILALIQLGGINIMVLSGFAAIILGRGLALRSETALGQVLDVPSARTARQLASFIVVATLVIEGLGALALTRSFLRQGMSLQSSAWRGLFHSVSAFCNAGFALQPDSLSMFRKDTLTLGLVALLILLGGFGFSVLATFWSRLRSKRAPGPLPAQVRIVLWMSAGLLVSGWLWFLASEWNHALAGLSPGMKAVHAMFQSVTARTAGFNSVDITAIQPATALFFIVLMFIGASPGGTGGGVKTTTAAVLLGTVPTITRGRHNIVLAGRTIMLETVYRSAAIVAIALSIWLGATLILLLSEHVSLEQAAFETMSALGTVGLSLGLTPHLTAVGKLVTVAVMFLGRVGPLTVALVLGRARPAKVDYPRARIMVG